MPRESKYIMNVADTSFWVAYYRAKETNRKNALFRDPFAELLAGEKGKIFSDSVGDIGRYTEWAVIIRTVIIDHFIEKLISSGVDAVINLGAGLDTRPYRLNLPPDLEWIEADYPEVIELKNKKLSEQNPKCLLSRIAVDLSDHNSRIKFFKNAAPLAKKVLILTEGVILYLKPEQVQELSKDLMTQIRFKFWVAEYFHPRVYPYLQKSLSAKKMKNSPFQFFPTAWYSFFKKLGWNELETQFIGEVAMKFNRQPPLPKSIEFLWPLFPQKLKNYILRLAGYVIFERN